MKRTILLLLAATTTFSCLFAQTAKNPFSQLGYKKQITYTSSKGEFEEFHDKTDVVEIGSVYFNTKTNKVVGYVNEEKENAEVATATSAMSVDPLCEKYYWISPYAFCLNNPVRFIDPDGREVVAKDKESQRNITNTLSKEESKYVRFKKDGTIDTRKLNKSKSESENMTALKTLANSDVKYNFVVASADGDGNAFYDKGDGNFYYGITMMPNTEGAPTGPDGNVWVYTASFLNEEKQAENTAHEGYGHALFYEKSRTDNSYDPFHRHVTQGSVIWNEEFKTNEFVSTRVDSNTKLDQQIKKVVTQTRVNYGKRTKK